MLSRCFLCDSSGACSQAEHILLQCLSIQSGDKMLEAGFAETLASRLADSQSTDMTHDVSRILSQLSHAMVQLQWVRHIAAASHAAKQAVITQVLRDLRWIAFMFTCEAYAVGLLGCSPLVTWQDEPLIWHLGYLSVPNCPAASLSNSNVRRLLRTHSLASVCTWLMRWLAAMGSSGAP